MDRDEVREGLADRIACIHITGDTRNGTLVVSAESFADALMPLIGAALADAWDEGAGYVNGCHDCCPSYREENPYREEAAQ